MKSSIALAVGVAAGLLGIGNILYAARAYTGQAAPEYARIGIPATGNATPLTVSGTTATACSLPSNSAFILTCDVDIFVEFDTTTPTVDSSSDFLPANTPREFATKDGLVSCVGVKEKTTGVGGTCRLSEWR